MAVFRLLLRVPFRLLLGAALGALVAFALAAPSDWNSYVRVQRPDKSGVSFSHGNISYLANTQHPRASVGIGRFSSLKSIPENTGIPLAVLQTNASSITQQVLEDIVNEYVSRDDVFSASFLDAVYITSSIPNTRLHRSAKEYLNNISVRHLLIDRKISTPLLGSPGFTRAVIHLEPGPYHATRHGNAISISTVYRLYEDTFRNFLYGTYSSEDGSNTFTATESTFASFNDSAIPVPSRLYSLNDPRPFAGYRVAVKDLFDMAGLITSGGSRAWASISSPAESTAPSLQRIVDLGGVLVGKYKLAQFASGADPWDWQDELYPFNTRGDGWLTCSASSSGGGCGIAAYDWLDFAVGSDTGSSMRRPAAVSGTYGQRPSQGMMDMEGALPEGGATDTAGVFSRDPVKWAHFSKHWYHPSMHQSTEKTGLSELNVPASSNFPTTILYPDDYLPLPNSAAQTILDSFITNMTTLFNMQVMHINLTATIQNASNPAVADLAARNNDVLNTIDYHPQWEEVAQPLINAWAEQFDGAFPPIDPVFREPWATFNQTGTTRAQYDEAVRFKRRSVEWYEQHVQFSTPGTCSESILVYDIGTGGLPSYREKELNNSPDASFLATIPDGTVMAGAGICPLYGCADFTVPIGQVEYLSPVSRRREWMPVTVNLVVKRECDFVVYDMVEPMAKAGILRTVKTGKTAF